MNLNEIDIEKTALLFFDMLNGFYHKAGDAKKARMKPMIDNAVRLMIGVTATVFAGRDMDYHMIVVRDACASVYDAEVHDILMDRVFPRMCRVRTTDEVLRMIIESSARKCSPTMATEISGSGSQT